MFLWWDRNTELAQAVDVMMAQAKIIYILMIIVNKFSFFVAEFSKWNRKHHCFPCFYRVLTLVKVLENSKKLWKHLPIDSFSHSISCSLVHLFHFKWYLLGSNKQKLEPCPDQSPLGFYLNFLTSILDLLICRESPSWACDNYASAYSGPTRLL